MEWAVVRHNAMCSYTRIRAHRLRGALFLVACSVGLAACSQNPVVYTKESFAADSPYQKKVRVGAAMACEGARRVLLGDGYVLDRSDGENVKGRKAYRSEADRSTFIEMSVVCVPDPAGSTLYASGLLSTYDVKKSTGSASVGVSAFGSVSLPFGQSADSMVKTSDETVNDREFYRRFFVAVEGALAEMQPEKAASNARPDAGRGVTSEPRKGAAPGNQATIPKQSPAPAAPEPAQVPQSAGPETPQVLQQAAPEPPQGPQQAEPGPVKEAQPGAQPAALPVTPPARPPATPPAVAPDAPSDGAQSTVAAPQVATPVAPPSASASTPVAAPQNASEAAAVRPSPTPAGEGTQTAPPGALVTPAPEGGQRVAPGAGTPAAGGTHPAAPGAPATPAPEGRQPVSPGTVGTPPSEAAQTAASPGVPTGVSQALPREVQSTALPQSALQDSQPSAQRVPMP
jgi:hypothetical protein